MPSADEVTLTAQLRAAERKLEDAAKAGLALLKATRAAESAKEAAEVRAAQAEASAAALRQELATANAQKGKL